MIHTRRNLWWGLFASSHPGPTLVVTVLAAGLGVAAGLSPWRLVLLSTAVFFGQLSVGLSNDALDMRRDRAVGRSDKPLARGDLSLRTAWTAAAVCLVAALVLSAPLGTALLAAHAIALVSAWSYNLGLKATAASILPFFITFGLFPSLATLSAPQPQLAQWWAWVAGATLGAAVHLTNVLPDLDDDARTGVHGLPHRLGLRGCASLAAAAVLIGAAAVIVGTAETLSPASLVSETALSSWVLTAVTVLIAVLTVGLAWAGRSGRVLFRLVMTAALVLALQLVLTAGSAGLGGGA